MVKVSQIDSTRPVCWNSRVTNFCGKELSIFINNFYSQPAKQLLVEFANTHSSPNSYCLNIHAFYWLPMFSWMNTLPFVTPRRRDMKKSPWRWACQCSIDLFIAESSSSFLSLDAHSYSMSIEQRSISIEQQKWSRHAGKKRIPQQPYIFPRTNISIYKKRNSLFCRRGRLYLGGRFPFTIFILLLYNIDYTVPLKKIFS